MSSGIYDSVNDTLIPTSGFEASKTIDATPTQNSANAVQSGGVYTALAEVNNALRTAYNAACATDTNVSAKVAINSYYELKDGQLVIVSFRFDVGANPTLNINNTGAKNIRYSMTTSGFPAGVIKSGDYALFRYYEKEDYYLLLSVSGTATFASEIASVNEALTNEVEARATLGAHNLLDNKALTTTFTDSDKTITFTVNSDKSVTVNGETGSSTNRGLILNSSVPTKLGVKYILSGCPSGGSVNTYDVSAYSSDFAISVRDFGEGVEFTGNGDTITVRVWVKNSTAVNNKVFYPMLRLATDAYSEYTPYVPTNAELLSADTNAVLGAHNFNGGNFTSQVLNGVTYTVNEDGTVTAVVGVGSSNSKITSDEFTLKAGTYTFSENPRPLPEGGSSNNCTNMSILDSSNNHISPMPLDSDTEKTFTLTEDKVVKVRLYCYANTSGSSYTVTFKPLIKLASDPSTAYQPYAKTNRELTDKLIKYVVVENITTGADGAFALNSSNIGGRIVSCIAFGSHLIIPSALASYNTIEEYYFMSLNASTLAKEASTNIGSVRVYYIPMN